MKEVKVDRPGARPDSPSARIVTELRRRIVAGELRAGARVPSTRQIAREWGVALATASKALDILCREGLLRAVPRVGTVVAGPEPRAAPASPRPRRRAEPESEQDLTRERIVQAALGIADAQGLEALSMRSVAARLGVPTMSLYRHVPGKDELVMGMADAAFREVELPSGSPPDWRTALEQAMRLQWSLFQRHPWLARVISITRPQLIPSGMIHTEWVLRALDGLGLDPRTMLQVHITVLGYVRGVAINLESEAEAEAETGLTSDEWLQTQDAAMDGILASGRFPMITRIAAEPDFDAGLDVLFEFGMQRLLDGLAVWLKQCS